jgi:alkaline phosphatase
LARTLLLASAAAASLVPAQADPVISRLTPPSRLFDSADPNPPIIARFLSGQRFDLQATVRPDAGQTISGVQFFVDGTPVAGTVTLTTSGLVAGLPANSTVASLRAHSLASPGVKILRATATQSDGKVVSAEGNFEVVGYKQQGRRAKNLIWCIGDGMGIAHRTAARIMMSGVELGKAKAPLAMDTFPNVALIVTHSLNSIVTDSSPGAACYSTGNKSNNNQQGVFPDDTADAFDNPRVELVGEYLARTQGKSLGIVTTSDVFDATPGAFGTHTANRGAGTGICDQYLDETAVTSGLKVLMGGGRKWFLPSTTPGSARATSSDYQLPADLATGWGVAAGTKDGGSRDLLADFQAAGWSYAWDNTAMQALPAGTGKLLGLFNLSNMNVALDKIEGRRNPADPNTVVAQVGLTDQPMLDEMAAKALDVLNQNPNGFVLMVEAASIDKQAHNMDTDRWILDTIEFDRAIAVCKQFAMQSPDTLVLVTADHECAGINIIGGSTISAAELAARAAAGTGAGTDVNGNGRVDAGDTAGLRLGNVGTYESAGFPKYTLAADGYPVTTDVDKRMLIGYAANADRYEDWIRNPLPLQDSQQPFVGVAPMSAYPANPKLRDQTGNFLVTGQIADSVAAHTASDIPLSAYGRGAALFNSTMDNTEPFFRAMQAVLGGSK